MSFTEQLKERQAIAVIKPQTLNNSEANSGNGMDMRIMRRARAILMTNTLSSTASINFVLKASDAVGGTYAAITGAEILTITTDNGNFAIEIRADQMPAGKPYLRMYLTETATQDAVVAGILIGDEAAYKPGSANNVATFTTQVVV